MHIFRNERLLVDEIAQNNLKPPRWLGPISQARISNDLFCRDEAKDRLMQRSLYLYLPVSVRVDWCHDGISRFFFRFSKVKVVILFQIKIVFLIFFCWCRVEFLWSLEFRNYLQYSWFWRVLTGFYEKEKNHEVMHFVNTLKKTSTVYLQIVTVQSVLRFP